MPERTLLESSVSAVMGRSRRPPQTLPTTWQLYVDGDIHTNTVENAFSLLKRGVIGTWHSMSAKHLAAHLDEMEFRFNRRKNHDLFRDSLRHMVTADPLTFETLTV